MDIKVLHGRFGAGGHFPVGGAGPDIPEKPRQINRAPKVVNRHQQTSWMPEVPVMIARNTARAARPGPEFQVSSLKIRHQDFV
ncbi:hypothetical protein [Rhizobium sp. CAU 1783]